MLETDFIALNIMPGPVTRASYVIAHYDYRMTTSSVHHAMRPRPASTTCDECAEVARGRRNVNFGEGTLWPRQETLRRCER